MESQTTLTGGSPPPPYSERADPPEAQTEVQALMEEAQYWTDHMMAWSQRSAAMMDALPLGLPDVQTHDAAAQGSQSLEPSQNPDEGENNDEDDRTAVITGLSDANVSAAALDPAIPGADSVEISSTRCQSLKTGRAGARRKKKKKKNKKNKEKRGKGKGNAESDGAQPTNQNITGPITRLIDRIKELLGLASASASASNQSAVAVAIAAAAAAAAADGETHTDRVSSPEHAARMQRTDDWINAVEHEETTICWVVVHTEPQEGDAAAGEGEPAVQFVWGRDGRETDGWYRVP